MVPELTLPDAACARLCPSTAHIPHRFTLPAVSPLTQRKLRQRGDWLPRLHCHGGTRGLKLVICPHSHSELGCQAQIATVRVNTPESLCSTCTCTHQMTSLTLKTAVCSGNHHPLRQVRTEWLSTAHVLGASEQGQRFHPSLCSNLTDLLRTSVTDGVKPP